MGGRPGRIEPRRGEVVARALGAAAMLGVAARALRRSLPVRSLAGKVVLITGGTRGLGLEMARQAAADGARVAICGRDGSSLDEARRELSTAGATVVAVRCDVSDREDVSRMVAAVVAQLGEVDLLIANAGVIAVGPLEEQATADFEEAMAIMYWGTVHPVLAVLPAMRRRGDGSIAIVTSIGGKVAVPHLLPYSGAKFAAVGFSEGLHAEVAAQGVRVTTVVPGLMRTGSHLRAQFKGRNREEFSWFALGASLPVVSMDVRRAARTILRAVCRGDAEVAVGLPAAVALRLGGVAPAATARVLAGMAALLPAPGGVGRERVPGSHSETPLTRSSITVLGRRAAARQRQTPGS